MSSKEPADGQPSGQWKLQGVMEAYSPEEALQKWLDEHPEHEGGIYFITKVAP